MKLKAKAQKEHLKKRSLERLGFPLHRRDVEDILREIKTNRDAFLWRQSNRVTLFRVNVKGTLCKVVYDSLRHNIVTIIPIKEGTTLN